MAFNTKEFRVRAGHTYQFTFENPDHMLHNLLIVKPGKAAVVGAMADDRTLDLDTLARWRDAARDVAIVLHRAIDLLQVFTGLISLWGFFVYLCLNSHFAHFAFGFKNNII